MKDNQTKYFLYARKSSEDDERQVKSIEDQINEVTEHARKLSITISSIFIESKSAKIPGRKVFNEMLKTIIKSKEPIVILAWHPDRLARNSVDGGQIIYLIDIGKIIKLEFPVFWFEPTPQGLFMLQIAFGQAKYYSDNLSENVKRGNRNKVKRGEWLGRPPFGYARTNTRNIEIVKDQAEIIRQLFKFFLTSKYSFSDLSRHLFYLGIKNRSGGIFKCCFVKRILTNSVYIGLIKYQNEVFEGTFDPIVSHEEFEKAQSLITRNAKPVNYLSRHSFLFTRLFRCGECGEAITAQIGRGNGGNYRYYRCCKRNKCSQSYLREESMIEQVKEFLHAIRLPQGWYDEMLDKARVKELEDKVNKRKVEIQISKRLEQAETKLQNLLRHFLDQVIGESEYFTEKERLIKIKMFLQKRRLDLNKRNIQYIRTFKEFASRILYAEELILSKDYTEIKAFLRRVTTNRIVKDKKISLTLAPPYQFILNSDELENWNLEKLTSVYE
jgi:site-specific DNA recombinase